MLTEVKWTDLRPHTHKGDERCTLTVTASQVVLTTEAGVRVPASYTHTRGI